MKKKKERKILVNRHESVVKFSEVDALGVVWHGHYIRYFEDGREAFGLQYDLGYLDVFANDFVTPIVKSEVNHKLPLRYGDTAIIESTYVEHPAAKILFEFKIYNKSTNELVATGSTTQVFLDSKTNELSWTTPTFYEEWKKKWFQ